MTSKKTTTTTSGAKVKTQEFHVAENRPGAGGGLWANTIGALIVLGMFTNAKTRKARTRGALQTLMGPTAVRYHLKKATAVDKEGAPVTNFRVRDDGKVELTDAGLSYFAGRVGRLGNDQRTDQKVDAKRVDAVAAAMKKGGTVEGIKYTVKVNVPA